MRYFWKGTISFGLINIPVGLLPASREHEVKFKLLHKKDLSEIRYARICKQEDKEVPFQQIVKGYLKNGRYSIMSEDDFKKAAVEKSNTIDVMTFCKESEIDSIYYEKPYFLKAEKGHEKAYLLLQKALEKSKKVAVVSYAMRNRNHIAVIKPYENVLLLNQLRFENEIIETDEVEVDKKVKISTPEINMAEKLIEQLTGSFEIGKFEDSYLASLKKSINKKGRKTIVKADEDSDSLAKIYDIMTLLKESVDKKPKNVSKKRAKA